MAASWKRFDVAVVGAGPAGATSALHLARTGLTVALLDRLPAPRYKTCGGGLVGRARRLLDVELDGCIEKECLQAEVHVVDADLSFTLRQPEPVVTGTMRSALDRRLVEAAQEAGAEFLAPCRFRDLTVRRGAVEIQTEDRSLLARFCVAADGAASRVARAAGWEENPNLVPALESEIRVAPGDYERLGEHARFDLGLPRWGYSWVFPKRRHLSVGCVCRHRGWHGLREDLDTYLARLELSEHGAREDHGFVIPIAPRSAELARGRVLLIGDAAGLADPVTCEGISWAILSGRMAAESIALHAGDPVAVRETYGRRLELELLPELRTARRLARLLYDRPRLRRLAFRRLGQPFCEIVGRVFLGETSYRDLLHRPANWLKLPWRFLRAA